MNHENPGRSTGPVLFISIALGLMLAYYYPNRSSAVIKKETSPAHTAQVSIAPISKRANKIALKAQKLYTEANEQFGQGASAVLATGENQKMHIRQAVLVKPSSSWFTIAAEPYMNYVSDAYSQERKLKRINKKLNHYKHEDARLHTLYEDIEMQIEALSLLSSIVMMQDQYLQEQQARAIRDEIALQGTLNRSCTPLYSYSYYSF